MVASASEHASSAGPTGGPLASSDASVERDLVRWKAFLQAQDELCETHGFPAAVLTIGVDHDGDLGATVDALMPMLRPTDRAGVLCDTEVSVVLVPVETIHEAQHLVQVIHGGLRSQGLAPHVGWAMRLDGLGLLHAAARADAAMLSSGGRGRLGVDISDRAI